MRNLIIPALCIFLLANSGCKVAEKNYRRGNYDEAIDRCVHTLVRNPGKESSATLLEKAFQKANDRDLASIHALNVEGQPDRWEEISAIYNRIGDRQNKIEPLLPLHIASQHRDAQFAFIDITDALATAKKNAAAFWYADAKQKLASHDKYQARQAWEELEKIKEFFNVYQDVDALLSQAREAGINTVVFSVVNNSDIVPTRNLQTQMNSIAPANPEGTWFRIVAMPQHNIHPDYYIRLSLNQLHAFPEQTSTDHYTDTKQIPNGYKNVYDQHGNIVKDSLGNPVMEQQYKTITAYVTVISQDKLATAAGDLQYLDNSGNRIIAGFPVSANGVFHNVYGFATGDPNALSQESKNKLGGKPLPFPGDEDMLLSALQTLNGIVNQLFANYNETYLDP